MKGQGATQALIDAVRSECKQMIRHGQAGTLTYAQIEQYVEFHAQMQDSGWWRQRADESLNWWVRQIRRWCMAYAEVAA